MTGDLHTFLRSRRSIRRFRPVAVPTAIIRRILETAVYAPSAHDKQPWRFVVLTTTGAKARLAEAITDKFRRDMTADGNAEADIIDRVERSRRRMDEAPVVIVLCWEAKQVNPQPDATRQRAETTMGVQSVALAGLQLLLAAHAEGLGSTWICWPLFAPEETRQSLKLPDNWEPQGMFFLGYPDEQPETPPRKSLSEVVEFIE